MGQMNLTKNGYDFLIKSLERIKTEEPTFDDADILKYGVVDSDLHELMRGNFINYDQDTDQFFWVRRSVNVFRDF